MKIITTLIAPALLSVFLALPAIAGTASIPIDATAAAETFLVSGISVAQADSMLITNRDYYYIWITCDANSPEDLVYAPFGFRVSGTDTTMHLPGFMRARRDTTGTLSPGQTILLEGCRDVDYIYFSAGKGKVVMK